MKWKEFFTGYKGKDLPAELKGFNWGAFLLTFIWGIKHKAWITLLGIPLIWFQLPLGFNWVLYTLLQFYCGFRGNMWAYQVDWWMSPKLFRKTQAMWAIVAISLNIIVPVILLSLALRFVQKSQDNPLDFLRNAQCAVANSKLEKGLSRVSINSSTSNSDIAKSFAKQFKNAKQKDNSVEFTVSAEGKKVELYSIDFNISSDAHCEIPKKNCTIESQYILPPELDLYSHCVFYFNDKREFQPDEETAQNLKKGFNFFKYL